MSDFRRILIIKPSSLGDIVHALPTLSAIRRRFPSAQVAWLVRKEWTEILEGHPDLNEVLTVDRRWGSWLSVIARLRLSRFDVAVDLQGLFRSGLVARVSGAPVRVGFAEGREGSPFFYTDRVTLPVPSKAPWRLLPMHAVDRNLAVAAYLGADISQPHFPIPAFPEEAQRVQRKLAGLGVDPLDVLIAVAPVDRRAVRSWPIERFVETAARLQKMHDVRIVLVGTPAQRWIVEPFAAAVGRGLVDLVGKTTVRELVALLRQVRLLLANDSAPLHIAAALGTPVVGLFGPTNPARARPYGEGHRVVQAGLACSPCESRACSNPHRFECFTAIGVDQVVESALQLLKG
jgi:lipopolysaccharide heptosyltransferase II